MAPKNRENGLKVWKHNWDKGEPGLQKKFFRPFGPQFGLKISGVEEGLGWIRHWDFNVHNGSRFYRETGFKFFFFQAFGTV